MSIKGAVGNKIVVRAIDDFRIVSVRIEIYSENGTLLETGDAQENMNGLDWTYVAKMTNNQLAGSIIKAIARDVPDNAGSLELVL